MKKINLLYLLICTLLFGACSDETFSDAAGYSEGEPATITMRIRVPEPTRIKSRAMGEERETAIEQLAIFAWEINSGRKMSLDLTGKLQCDEWSSTGGSSIYSLTEAISALTGRYRAYIIGNWNSVYAAKDATGAKYTFDDLDALTEAELKEILVNNFDNHIDLYGNDGFPISQIIEPDATHTNGFEIAKPESQGTNTLSGINLVRATAHIHFIITNDSIGGNANYTGTNVPNFMPQRYTVYRVPKTTSAFSSQKYEVLQEGTFNSDFTPIVKQPDQVGDPGYEFDFHMLENIQPLATNTITDQSQREAWKYTSGTNTDNPAADTEQTSDYASREFTNAPAGATFVVIEGTYSGPAEKLDDGTYSGTQYYGNLSYIIHLGNFGTDSPANHPASLQDFSVMRNELQTYKITVQGARSILVSMQVENQNPAVEGNISKIPVATLDAHYSKIMLQMSKGEFTNDGKVTVNQVALSTVVTGFENKVYTIDELRNDPTADYKWVQFQKPTSKDLFPTYAGVQKYGQEGGFAYVTDLAKDIQAYLNGEKETPQYALVDGDILYIAAFVDENIYPDNSVAPMKQWAGDVVEDRVMSLNPGQSVSPDGTKILSAQSAFTIRQLPVSSPYSLQPGVAGMDVEHYNPYGLEQQMDPTTALETTPTGYTLNDFISTNKTTAAQFFHNALWWDGALNPFSDPNTGLTEWDSQKATVFLFSAFNDGVADENKSFYKYDSETKSYNFVPAADYNTVSKAIVAHNRDLDGDGLIKADEVRWYVPSFSQYLVYNFGYTVIEESLRIQSVAAEHEAKLAYTDIIKDGDYDNAFPRYFTSSLNFNTAQNIYNKRVYWQEQRGANSTLIYNVQWIPRINRVRFARNLGQFEGSYTAAWTPMSVRHGANGGIHTLRFLSPYISRSYDVTVAYPFGYAVGPYNQLPRALEYDPDFLMLASRNDVSDITSLKKDTGEGTYAAVQALVLRKYKERLKAAGKDTTGMRALPDGWRIPNQRELYALNILNIPRDTLPAKEWGASDDSQASKNDKFYQTDFYSCTYLDSELYPLRGKVPFMISGGNNTAPESFGGAGIQAVILVRDVNPDTGEPIAKSSSSATSRKRGRGVLRR